MHTQTREIAVSEWKTFLDLASRHYQGRPVRIEFAGRDIGLYLLADRVPLIGLTFEKQSDGTTQIEVMAGSPENGEITHVVSDPRHLWVRQEINGCDNGIFIENAAGQTVLVEIKAASSPFVDECLKASACAAEACAAPH